MRMFKSSALVCAGFLCIGVSVRAQDNAAQAAARAALLQKMQEMDQQGDNNNNTTSFTSVPTDVPRTSAKPAKNSRKGAQATVVTQTPATAPVQVTSFAPTPSVAPAMDEPYTMNQDNSAQTAARAALMHKMQELDIEDMHDASANAAATANPATGLPDAVAATNPPALPEPFFEPPPQIVETPQQQQMRQPRPSNKRTFTQFQSPTARAAAAPAMDQYGFAPVQAPPAPVSQEKEIELRALLAKYRADLLSPSEYQTERARIISEP